MGEAVGHIGWGEFRAGRGMSEPVAVVTARPRWGSVRVGVACGADEETMVGDVGALPVGVVALPLGLGAFTGVVSGEEISLGNGVEGEDCAGVGAAVGVEDGEVGVEFVVGVLLDPTAPMSIVVLPGRVLLTGTGGRGLAVVVFCVGVAEGVVSLLPAKRLGELPVLTCSAINGSYASQ